MRPLLTPEQMAAADAAAISAGTAASVLMERAGAAVARAVVRRAGARYGTRVLIVCGSGNNGGDGYVAARHLHRQGLDVRCMSLAEVDVLSDDAAAARREAVQAGVRMMPLSGTAAVAFAPDLAVDAMFGTGFRGSLEGPALEGLAALNVAREIVSVDIPSGIAGATGRAEGAAVHAAATVAIAAEKIGTALPPGSVNAGDVEVVDIGIELPDERTPHLDLVSREDLPRLVPDRPAIAHKGSVGSVAVLAGSPDIGGAALLTARGALRAGAGYVMLGSVEGLRTAALGLPELLFRAVSDGEPLGPEALDRFEDERARADAIAVGPGLGEGRRQRDLVRHLLAGDTPLVVDADALNVLKDEPAVLADASAPRVLTPHPAELARLLHVKVEDVVADRLAAALEAGERFSCTVVAKGARTIVAGPGRATVIGAGGPELATAGSGDVLCGAIAAFLAAGMNTHEAAVTGALAHATAGALAAERAGVIGVVATDVADLLGVACDASADTRVGAQ